MTQLGIYQQELKEICNKGYYKVEQILIDFIQEDIEQDLILGEPGVELTHEDFGAASYRASILLDVYNPKFESDVAILKELKDKLDEISKALE